MLQACHLWSLLEKQGKQEQRLLLLSAGFPSTPLTEPLMESEKQKQFVETTKLIERTAPDRFLVILPGPQRLIHTLKNCRIRQTMNRRRKMWRCQMEDIQQVQAVHTMLRHA